MSKDIWHTVDETPKPYEDIAFYVDGYLYSSYYNAQYNQYGIFGADKVEKWCYSKDLSSYILALETELECTHKALDVAWDGLEKIGSGNIIEHSVVGHEDDNKIFIANKALDESKTVLEQKE